MRASHLGKPLSSPGTEEGLSCFYGLKSKDKLPLCSAVSSLLLSSGGKQRSNASWILRYKLMVGAELQHGGGRRRVQRRPRYSGGKAERNSASVVSVTATSCVRNKLILIDTYFIMSGKLFP